METQETSIPDPVDGKFVFQVDHNMRIRFNADGWVEEIGKGTTEDNYGTKLQGVPGTKLDDLYAERYYDLYSRIVLLDIHSDKGSGDKSGARGTILFRDLEPGSPMYNRINLVIAIANHHFNMNLKPLG